MPFLLPHTLCMLIRFGHTQGVQLCSLCFSSFEVSKGSHFSKILHRGISIVCDNLIVQFQIPLAWLNVGALLLFQI